MECEFRASESVCDSHLTEPCYDDDESSLWTSDGDGCDDHQSLGARSPPSGDSYWDWPSSDDDDDDDDDEVADNDEDESVGDKSAETDLKLDTHDSFYVGKEGGSRPPNDVCENVAANAKSEAAIDGDGGWFLDGERAGKSENERKGKGSAIAELDWLLKDAQRASRKFGEGAAAARSEVDAAEGVRDGDISKNESVSDDEDDDDASNVSELVDDCEHQIETASVRESPSAMSTNVEPDTSHDDSFCDDGQDENGSSLETYGEALEKILNHPLHLILMELLVVPSWPIIGFMKVMPDH